MARLAWILLAALTAAACGGAYISFNAQYVKVYKSRGAIQCVSIGTPPEIMWRDLNDAGITVVVYSCGSDGRMYAAMCGRPDDKINIFTIPEHELDDALALQFQLLDGLPDAGETGCP